SVSWDVISLEYRRQLYVVEDHVTNLFLLRRFNHRGTRNRFATLRNIFEILSYKFLCCRDVDVAGNGQGSILRHIKGIIEVNELRKCRLIQVIERADRNPPVGVNFKSPAEQFILK